MPRADTGYDRNLLRAMFVLRYARRLLHQQHAITLRSESPRVVTFQTNQKQNTMPT
jgi:hypothetical protein